jgi:hypothetical protein
MAQLDFYLNGNDKNSLVSYVLSEGGYLVPDINYNGPKFNVIDNLEDYQLHVNQNRLLFILHNSYSKQSLTWRKIQKENKTVYYIPQRVGGPTIDFYSPGLIEKDGQHYIGPGNVSHYPSYFDTALNSYLSVSEELKLFYKRLISQIKKNSYAIKLNKRTYWIGNGAIKDISSGYNLINIENKVLIDFLKFVRLERG